MTYVPVSRPNPKSDFESNRGFTANTTTPGCLARLGQRAFIPNLRECESPWFRDNLLSGTRLGVYYVCISQAQRSFHNVHFLQHQAVHFRQLR